MSDIGLYLLAFGLWSLMGLILIGVGLHTLRYQRKKESRERALTAGRIVEAVKKVHRAAKGGNVTYYVPVVEFQAEGQAYRLENENGSREQDSIIVGKMVDVLYDPADPTHFHLTEDDANDQSAHSLIKWGVVWIVCAAALTAVCRIFGVF